MKLAEHTAKLLLVHDCVIIPNFGGFVAYHEPAKLLRNVLLPAKREIGFNAKLTHNDGLLAEAYMKERNCSFDFAERLIHSELDDFSRLLKENNRAVFGEIGTLTYENNSLTFEPNKDYVAPQYFGLDDFHFYPKYVVRETAFARFMKYAAVIAAAVMMLLPSNFDTRQNEASLLPVDWNKKIFETETPQNTFDIETADISEVETIVSLPEETEKIMQPIENYHVIIASFATERQAERYLREVANYNFADMHIVKCEGRCRIAVQSFAENVDAEAFRDDFIGKYPDFSATWIFKEKI